MGDQPSLKALSTFATAARLQSFKAAAEQLHVSPSAVSHQIAALEGWLGKALFERTTRSVSLTADGAVLSRALQTHFQGIEDALATAKANGETRTLRISALPLFANSWLLPRLGRFEAAQPALTILLDTRNSVSDLNAGQADIGIRNTRIRASGLVHRKLIDLHYVPLCSPKLATDVSCAELLELPLIVHSARPDSWRRWLHMHGVEEWPPRKTLSVDTLPGAMAAAAEGAGVLLGLAPFVWEAAGVDKLCDPIGLPLQPAGDYCVVHRRSDKDNTDVQAFVSWLRGELRADYHRLQGLRGPS